MQSNGLKQRELITLLGSAAAAWPMAAGAQQRAMPVIGFLALSSLTSDADHLRAFRQGLKDSGYIEGDNVIVEYRSADDQYERLPSLAADLIDRRVAVIVTVHGPAVPLAVRAATTTIPIIFLISSDPVGLGLVRSLARPGGNATGVNFLSGELVSKRLELLRELVPGATSVAVLVNPANTRTTEVALSDLEPTARSMGLKTNVSRADTSDEINSAFAALARERPDALFVASSAFLTSRRIQIVQLAARHGIPATYPGRQYVDVGGLMSYGANLADAWRQLGLYAARILKGAKPEDLPVVQSSRLELVINRQTARMLDLILPPSLLATADEVIE